ncbi:mannose-P-dolichol utilization defect 1 protein-like [Babylonia areolata]|uniref:mannose-P-dolichol utilization defect 1 protein-like n=1 Tax=Babylonia areolata TaxID=304850 RepID=UPI003FD23F63
MWSSARVVPKLMLQPVTVPVSMSTTNIPSLVSLLLPGCVFHDVLQQWHLHTAGLSSLASLTRVIGYLLIITTSGLQLPNIFKMLKSRSCEGVSLLSTAILLHSTSANVAYCINLNMPLSTWAESVPLMAQYIMMMCLLLLYEGRQRRMLLFVLLYVLLMLPLLLGVVPAHLVSSLKVLTLPLTLMGKVYELYSTYKRGGTGQKSKKSIFLLNMRSGGRLLTSIFDTRDTVLVLCYAHACFWNTLITCQTVYYGHKRRRRMREERKRKESEERAARSASEISSRCSSDYDSDVGLRRSPRRRRRFNGGSLPFANTS